MGIRSILIALVGVTVAGGSAFATREYLNVQIANAATEPTTGLVTVVAAATDIPYGQTISPQSLQVLSWPESALPPGVFTTVDSLVPQSGQPPRRATRAMAQGDLIVASKVSDFGEKVTIVQSLGPNARAMAIKVDAETAVGGFVTPGDSVDVVLTQGRDAELRAVTVLQNIRVIGVDQQADERSDQPEIARTVTVEVTPEQGQVLALAQEAGTLSLTLRTLDQATDQPLSAIKLADILNEPEPPPVVEAVLQAAPVAAPPPRTTVRISRAAGEPVVVDVGP